MLFDERPMSANSLRTYLSCPLRFRYRYLDGLPTSRLWSAPAEERNAVERGENFHLMARRYYAGVDPGRAADPVEQRELESWLGLLQSFLPLTFDRLFYPELELELNRPGFRLMAKFDLLVVEPDGRALLFDWKTEKRRPRRDRLEQEPQTLVYRYMLCAAGGRYSPLGRFMPGQVSMIYWNPLHPTRWEPLPYSEEQYRRDEERLTAVMAEIRGTDWAGFLPTDDQQACRSCEFQLPCRRRVASEPEVPADRADEEEPPTWEVGG